MEGETGERRGVIEVRDAVTYHGAMPKLRASVLYGSPPRSLQRSTERSSSATSNSL